MVATLATPIAPATRGLVTGFLEVRGASAPVVT
jgi:hypothetical protein